MSHSRRSFFAVIAALAAIPALVDGALVPVKGKFHIDDYVDVKKRGHFFRTASTGLCIPVGIDQIWTGTVTAV